MTQPFVDGGCDSVDQPPAQTADGALIPLLLRPGRQDGNEIDGNRLNDAARPSTTEVDGSGPTSTSTAATSCAPVGAAALQRIEALEEEIRGLEARQITRGTIDQAKGMLMAYYGVPADAAFAILVRWSQQSNTKLRDIAAGLVAAASQPHPHPYGGLSSMLPTYTADDVSVTVQDAS